MKEIRERRSYVNIFDNITELTQYLKKPTKEGRETSSEKEGSGFSGTNTFQEAWDLLKFGDDKLYEQIKEKKMKMNFDKNLGNVSNRQRYVPNITGCVPNISEFLKGNPINMIDVKRNKLSHRVLNIFLDNSVTGDTDKEYLFNNGVAYLNIIDLLEKAGYRCNVYVGSSTEFEKFNYNGPNHHYDIHMYLKVKTDREPLNIKKICFPIAHPSFLRRIYFKWAEVYDYDLDMTHEGYGSVRGKKYINKTLKPKMKEDFIVWSFSDDNAAAMSFEQIIQGLENDGIKIDVNK